MTKIEKIIWDDAGSFICGDDEIWSIKKDIISAYFAANFTITSIGHVVYEDEDSVIIAQSHDKLFDQYSNPLRIPKGMIKERKCLNKTLLGFEERRSR